MGAGQVSFRGGLPPGMQPGGFAAAPTANLFSSIVLPDVVTMGGGGGSGPTGNHSDDSSGGDGTSGRGKTAEQRAAAVQEKNRRAQKRFRERQVRHRGGAALV